MTNYEKEGYVRVSFEGNIVEEPFVFDGTTRLDGTDDNIIMATYELIKAFCQYRDYTMFHILDILEEMIMMEFGDMLDEDDGSIEVTL